MSHTIAAVSTGNVISAIGIIRLTGDDCAAIGGTVFTCKNGNPLMDAPNRKQSHLESKYPTIAKHIGCTQC